VRVVLQRVTEAAVRVGDEVAGAIGPGLVALVGVAGADEPADAVALARKTARLRVFPGLDGGPERDVLDAGGSVLVVSQFTLLADTRRGNRPSWSPAAPPERARDLVEAFAHEIAAHGVPVETGRFGAAMSVHLVNDGPLTILLDSRD
jgi:D-tyrosyl-tRNA(Tyr) deacylase